MENKLHILLVEDDRIERLKFLKVVKKMAVESQVFEVENGEEAIEYLLQSSKLPSIVVLDLNMPKMNGIEFLSKLKKDNRLKYLPAIVLTTSCNQKDLLECYRIGIAGYVLKPLRYDEYEIKIRSLITYWNTNELV
ncbi:MAG: response regulator [Flavobacteriaceae bacterium]|nr:MAG: response regulator [Flavobacteriaceae bacterium]